MSDAAQTQVAAALGSVSSAVSTIGSLQGAAASTLNGLYGTVYAASTALDALATDLDADIGVGAGVAAGNDPDVMAAFLAGQIQTCQDETLTLTVKDNIDLIGKNILLALG
ncbi:MAG: hypothetical protein ACTHKQ_11845 [Mesorhizobium sp.]